MRWNATTRRWETVVVASDLAARIIEMRKAGAYYKEIMDATGAPQSRICRVLQKAGCQKPRRKAHL